MKKNSNITTSTQRKTGILSIVFLSVIIIGLIATSFFMSTEKYQITFPIILLLCLLVIVVLCNSFNYLSLGKFLTLVKSDNYYGEIVLATDEEIKEENKEIFASSSETITRRINRDKLEKYIYEIYLKGQNTDTFKKNVKFDTQFDPVGVKPVIFDAFIRNDNEKFIEITWNINNSYFLNKLYVQLNKILHYKINKNINTLLLLIFANIISEENNDDIKKIEKYYSPAIDSGLLKIHTIDIYPEDEKYIYD